MSRRTGDKKAEWPATLLLTSARLCAMADDSPLNRRDRARLRLAAYHCRRAYHDILDDPDWPEWDAS